MVLLFLTNSYVRDLVRRWVAMPSLDRLKMYSAKQIQNMDLTRWKNAVDGMPASKSNSVSSFRH